MKDVKLIGLYLAPHFLAISLLLAFIAARCDFASSCALSYEIAPVCSQSLIVLISSVCFIISSFIFAFSYVLDFKGIPCDFQGKTRFFVVFLRVLRGISVFFVIFLLSGYFSFFCKKIRNHFFFHIHLLKTELKTLCITQSKRNRRRHIWAIRILRRRELLTALHQPISQQSAADFQAS